MDKVIEKKKGFRMKHLLWGLGIVILLFFVIKLIKDGKTSVFRAEADKITISTVEENIFNDYITVTGQVEPITTIYLDAVEGGRVSERLIEEGSMVNKGDVILRLENRQLYQNILDSEAALAEKENYLRSTRISFETELIQSKRNILDSEYKATRKKRTYEQYKTLYDQGLISKEDYLQSKEDYEYEIGLLEINRIKAKNDSILRATSMITLENDLGKMRQMLGLVHERLDNLNVKAPVDGQLGMLDAEIGQSIGSGQRIGQINVLTNFKINAKIDEHYIDRVQRGLSASFDRNGTEMRLTVRKVYPEVREGQFEIDMVFEGALPENLRTGQTYHIKLELGESEKAIMIPRGGFFQSTGGQWVFVLNEAGDEAVKRTIRIGKQNPQYYEVLEGLKPGEKVITSGYELFGDNDKIVLK
ncbi:MAG TPA: efflux RND transporter periplasmic adaptor subunit [Bacteroidales bacterium]|nr:efflux RND transporter periplasmic adaptor subunit [Bacteroidales bacterium]HPT20891.1 efflux RND transporter periplasmic adaptor subunit [Bacteroidales bacterium]